MKFLILALVICAAVTVFADEDDEAWQEFKLEHGKLFLSKGKETVRKQNFLNNRAEFLDLQAKAEAGEIKFTPKLYAHADLSEDEFVSRFGGIAHVDEEDLDTRSADLPPFEIRQAYPTSFSSVAQGWVGPVRNQGGCNSCWAFAALCTVEVGLAKNGLGMRDLSEQQMVDCAKRDCNPSSVTLAYEYLENNGGCLENEYPYTGVYQGQCRRNGGNTRFTNRLNVAADANSIKAALMNNGALMIIIDCGPWSLYGGGVFHLDKGNGPNHAVTLVGWGSENGDNYWLVRNSWGTNFGENGYIKLSTAANGGYNFRYTWGVQV